MPPRLVKLWGIALLTGAIQFAPVHVSAQTFPSKPITILLPTQGGPADVILRTLSPKVTEILRQPLILEARPGANGAIAAAAAKQAAADGYILLVGNSGTMVISPQLTPSSTFDVRDFGCFLLSWLSLCRRTVPPN